MMIDGIPAPGPNLFLPKGHYWFYQCWSKNGVIHSETQKVVFPVRTLLDVSDVNANQ